MRTIHCCGSIRDPPHPFSLHLLLLSYFRHDQVLPCARVARFVIHLVAELGALVVAASPSRQPGSAHHVLYESPSGKSVSGESQHYFGFRISATSHADVMPSTMDYLRLPDVSPPSAASDVLRVVERDASFSRPNSNLVANTALTLAQTSSSVGSPASSKKKMGMSSMFRLQSK